MFEKFRTSFDPCIMVYEVFSKNRGILPPKWMVKIMENLIKNGMIWGGLPPLFLETPIC